jgi:hypothetical protein
MHGFGSNDKTVMAVGPGACPMEGRWGDNRVGGETALTMAHRLPLFCCWSVFHLCDQISEKNNLKEARCVLAYISEVSVYCWLHSLLLGVQ